MANNIIMIYLIGFLAGILNGFFATGAGQIIIFYLVFIMKIDSHIGRGVSIAVLSVASVFTITGYTNFVKFDLVKVIVIVGISCITGIIGSKFMDKINSKVLNFSSGIIVVCLAIYGFVK